jgi:hypothetical protein
MPTVYHTRFQHSVFLFLLKKQGPPSQECVKAGMFFLSDEGECHRRV